ncbi:unnamed protein product [Ectocarpus sp. 12 AP-2014]
MTMRSPPCSPALLRFVTLVLATLTVVPGSCAFVVTSSGRPSLKTQPRCGGSSVMFSRARRPSSNANRRPVGGSSVGGSVRGGTTATRLVMGAGNISEDADGGESSDYSAWPAINRKAIGALASVGALESAYLTYQKIHPAGLDLLCGASGGCLDVLNGPYSNVLGVPLSAFGTLGYLAAAGLAVVPLFAKEQSASVDKTTRSLLLVVTTAMGVFSLYLLSLLKFKIGYPCPWCLTSAGLSLSMCIVAWMKRAVPEKTKAAVVGACTTLITAFACLSVFVVTETALDIRQAEASPGELVGVQLVAPPLIDTESSPQALRIGKKLKSLDAKMYGAYWCTHCFNQKEMLGKQAMSKVKYIECSNRGVDNQVDMCKAADIPGFPTWDIDGKLYPGEQTLEELEEIVGLAPYKG